MAAEKDGRGVAPVLVLTNLKSAYKCLDKFINEEEPKRISLAGQVH